ncbi:HTH domain-containing protein [Leuconostoc mesenteroides]|uniref:HTH domain-containing protein n=1 Tax=Leuconostoc mesenteroides TaxID=1245 RepID=UPI001B8DA86D|nr:HTH domain-containing protein [Leuconostoc mesenteroides]MBS0943256.1 HTH domain-containing protein [Leuconostoc mesenteroides]
MSENLKTIRELAEELDVSKQAIQYHIKSLTNKNRQTNDKGVVVLSIEEQQFIRSRVDKKSNKKLASKQTNKRQRDKQKSWDINQYLLSQIEEVKKSRDKQLENKDLQISQMQNLLDQQQRLALQDKKLLEEYKSEIKNLKALNMPSQNIEKNYPVQTETTVENIKGVSPKKNKKWWHFW